MSEFDNPWKDVLEHFFGPFLEFFFPEAHAAVDWSRNYESLDKELQQIVSDSELGLRLADKLFKVWLNYGEEAWILLHVEVHNQRDPRFPERMFVYVDRQQPGSEQLGGFPPDLRNLIPAQYRGRATFSLTQPLGSPASMSPQDQLREPPL
jgi:hypothetical protein